MGNFFAKLRDLFSKKEMEIVIVGLENSGKSTLTSKLTEEDQAPRGPTIGLDIKTVRKNNLTIKMWDLGGQGLLKSPVPVRMVKICNWLCCHYVRGGHVR